MKIQHLVLDDDVHKALKSRKVTANMTVREIGNSALRSALHVPTREELVIQQLVETGKISRKDYDKAAAAANRDLKSGRAAASEPVVSPPDGTTITVGSWQGKTIHLDPDGLFALFSHQANDGKKTSSSLHEHSEAHSWAFVIKGKVRVRIGAEEHVLGPGQAVHIPPGVPHNTTPLTSRSVMLMLMSPPEPKPRHRLKAAPAKKTEPRKTTKKGRDGSSARR